MAKNEKDKQTNNSTHDTTYKTKEKKTTQTPPKTRGDIKCSERVSRSCSTCGTRRVAYEISNPVNSLLR